MWNDLQVTGSHTASTISRQDKAQVNWPAEDAATQTQERNVAFPAGLQ